MLRQNDSIIFWISQNWGTNGMAGRQNLQVLNILAIGVGGGICDDTLAAGYGRSTMEFIHYWCCIPKKAW